MIVLIPWVCAYPYRRAGIGTICEAIVRSVAEEIVAGHRGKSCGDCGPDSRLSIAESFVAPRRRRLLPLRHTGRPVWMARMAPAGATRPNRTDGACARCACAQRRRFQPGLDIGALQRRLPAPPTGHACLHPRGCNLAVRLGPHPLRRIGASRPDARTAEGATARGGER